MKVYIAGKVSGLPRAEVIEKFERAEKCLIEHGHEVVNPMKLVPAGTDWFQAMRICIREMMICEAVFVLPDWLGSRGAILETDLADDLEIMVADKIEDLTVENLAYYTTPENCIRGMGPGH